jgi:hypothetical protein
MLHLQARRRGEGLDPITPVCIIVSTSRGGHTLSGACYVRPVLPILPTMSTLSINCLLLGIDSSEVFTVEILKTKNVSILKRLTKEEQSHRLNHVDAGAYPQPGLPTRG